MPLQAPKRQRILPPEGTHIARCIQLIQIGTVMESYMGEEQEMHKIFIAFELTNERREFKEGDGPKPFVVSGEYSLSMGSKANLRKLVEGMMGKSLTSEEADLFDLTSLVGKPCLLTIKTKMSKNGNEYTIIASASPLLKGQEAPDAFNETKTLTYENFDNKVYASLPEFMREKIRSSKEFMAMEGSGDIPF